MKKWVHVIGIAGVSTSGVAIMFKRLGWKVTGSDKGFFPPVSTHLEKNGIDIAPGFKSARLTHEESHPDIVVYSGTLGAKNEELVESKRLKLRMMTFPEVLSEYVVRKENSIVVAGTYGKTSISSALVEMFAHSYKSASYMVGGIPVVDKDTVVAADENSEYSIVEGDEYLISLEDRRSKFWEFSTKYLIINSIQWEHPDLFPTEKEYIENFRKLVKSLPADGLLVANANDKQVCDVAKDAPCDVKYYSVDKDAAITLPDWILNKESTPLPTFISMPNTGKFDIIPYEKKIIGDFNEENLLAATVMAYELGIKKEKIQDAIENFRGVKRRLEIRLEKDNLIIIDDFGSSPPKAKGALKALRDDFPEAKILAVFEPNTGNRTQESLPIYKGAFDDADQVFLPRFTKLPKTKQDRFGADVLAKELSKFYNNIQNINDDELLLEAIVKSIGNKTKTVIVFMGSHSFRGMIEEIINKIDK